MAKVTYKCKSEQNLSTCVEDEMPAVKEVKVIRRKSPGRPSKGKVRKISLSIPLDVYEGVKLASYFFKGNVTEYINTVIRRDLSRNLENYREFKITMENLSEGMQEET